MANHPIKCEAIEVRTESGICPGLAKTRQGEVCALGVRTPELRICSQAFNAIYPMAFAMRLTDRMDWEQGENRHFDTMCPHGFVTFRVSRMEEEE